MYKRQVEIVISKSEILPDPFYESHIIIGAANVSNILDVSKLKSGTIIIDDSRPHCFSVEKAIERFELKKDILFIEAGPLKLPNKIKYKNFIPKNLTDHISLEDLMLWFKDQTIMGCTLSSLLVEKYENIKPVIGNFGVQESINNYHTLKQMGVEGADLYCDTYWFSQKDINHFKTNRLKTTKKSE